jgi:hypothetical protein
MTGLFKHTPEESLPTKLSTDTFLTHFQPEPMSCIAVSC